MPDFEDLNRNIKDFLDIYGIMTPEAKAAFEAQLDKTIHGANEQSKILYQTLRQAAKDNLSVDEAISNMQKAVHPHTKAPLPIQREQ